MDYFRVPKTCVIQIHLTIGINYLLYLTLCSIVGAIQDSPCPSGVTEVSPYGSSCTSVCWSETNGTNGFNFDPRVTYRSHLPYSRFDVGTTEVTYRYDVDENTSGECTFLVNVKPACISGRFDAITRAEELGSFYAFVGDLVIKLKAGGGIAPGYPKPICAVFPGLPSDLDAVLYHPTEGITYFFKGDHYWTSTGRSVSPSNDRYLTTRFYGAVSDLDAAFWWPKNNLLYFFKDNLYRRYNEDLYRVSGYPSNITEGWEGVGVPVDAVGSWGLGRTYFFSGEDYWLYDDIRDQAISDGYPRSTTKHWLGCTADDSDLTIIGADNICVAEVCSEDPVPSCPVADFDAITHLDTGNSMGNIFIFRGRMVVGLTEASGAINEGFPRPICTVFPGLSGNLDAALTWKDTGETYFFKGDSVYRFTGFRLHRGFPSPIRDHFPGIPSDIDAALVTGTPDDQQTFFFKDDMFYRFDRGKGSVAPGYPQAISSYWTGLTGASRVNAALQWINGWSYLFRGEQFFRWDFVRQRVADGYPRQTDKIWFGCRTQDERNRCWIRQCT